MVPFAVIDSAFVVAPMMMLVQEDRYASRTAVVKGVVKTVSVKMVSVALRTRACGAAATIPTASLGNAVSRTNAFSPALRTQAAEMDVFVKMGSAKTGAAMTRAVATIHAARTTSASPVAVTTTPATGVRLALRTTAHRAALRMDRDVRLDTCVIARREPASNAWAITTAQVR